VYDRHVHAALFQAVRGLETEQATADHDGVAIILEASIIASTSAISRKVMTPADPCRHGMMKGLEPVATAGGRISVRTVFRDYRLRAAIDLGDLLALCSVMPSTRTSRRVQHDVLICFFTGERRERIRL